MKACTQPLLCTPRQQPLCMWVTYSQSSKGFTSGSVRVSLGRWSCSCSCLPACRSRSFKVPFCVDVTTGLPPACPFALFLGVVLIVRRLRPPCQASPSAGTPS